jgi:hypothetical protein
MACLCLACPITDTHHYCMHPRTVSFFPDHRPGRKDCWDSLSYCTVQQSAHYCTVDFLVQHTTRSLLSSSLPPSSLAHGSLMIGSRLDALMGKRAAIPVQCDDQSGATPEQLGPRGSKFLGVSLLANHIILHHFTSKTSPGMAIDGIGRISTIAFICRLCTAQIILELLRGL